MVPESYYTGAKSKHVVIAGYPRGGGECVSIEKRPIGGRAEGRRPLRWAIGGRTEAGGPRGL